MAKQKTQFKTPVLVMLYGLPGAGKTHFANNIVEDVQAAHISGDRIRSELFENPTHEPQEDAIVNQLMLYMAQEFLQAGVSVVFDTNAARKATRHDLRELARSKDAESMLVWFQMDLNSAFERSTKRDRRLADDKYAVTYSQEEFQAEADKMQHPDPTEEYLVVSGKHNFKSQRSAFLSKMAELGFVQSANSIKDKVAKPGLVNLVPPSRGTGKIDFQ